MVCFSVSAAMSLFLRLRGCIPSDLQGVNPDKRPTVDPEYEQPLLMRIDTGAYIHECSLNHVCLLKMVFVFLLGNFKPAPARE